jgi:hypothetical protein
MIFSTDVGVPLSLPSLASVSQMPEQFVYFPGHTREDIPSGNSARCLRVLDRGYANFRERRQAEVRRISLPRTPLNGGKTKGLTIQGLHRTYVW